MNPQPYKIRRKCFKHQLRFINSEHAFPALVAGFGAGKSEAGFMRAVNQKFKYPTLNTAYYLPTYDLIREIAEPRLEQYIESTGRPYKLNKSEHNIYIEGAGKILLRSMERPEKIIGYEVGDSIFDELDTLKIDKAREVWNKGIARNRSFKPDGKPNTAGVVTTPEGFRFVYEKWAQEDESGANLAAGYELIKASTYDNIYLPQDYIQNLLNSYPSQLIQAYLNGEFVNLVGKRIYTNFNRVDNNSDEVAKAHDVLHIGVDFNVANMTAIVHKYDEERRPHAIDEITGVFDTPQMCQAIRDRYPEKMFSKIWVYPDASGDSRKTNNASTSDIQILRQAGFVVDAPKKNPAVKDRVLAMNMKFKNGKGEPEYFVNVERCGVYTKALEQQIYNAGGMPDKEGGLDHPTDAGGYFIHRKHPLKGIEFGRIKTKW